MDDSLRVTHDSAERRHATFAHFLMLVAAAAVVFRLWTSVCFFLLPEWNSVRLAPTFMLRFGVSPYPQFDGPLTTWIYGPVPLLIHLPATLANDAVTALLSAAIINMACTIIPIVGVAVMSTAPGACLTRIDRVGAVLLALTLWPNTSLHYLQADNIAVGFGLLSNGLLTRRNESSPTRLAVAAYCAALAVWSKQTAIGLVLAQLIWLISARGTKAALHYGFVLAGIGLALGFLFVAWFGIPGLWLNLIRVPGRLPWCPDFLERTLVLKNHLLLDVLLPGAAIVLARRSIWRSGSPWMLPTVTWLCLLPAGLLSIYKVGGASNALNGYLYLVVPASLACVAWLKRRWSQFARGAVTAGIIAILTQQLQTSPLLPLQPMSTHLEDAAFLAARNHGRIYFPWHPLVTWFSDRRFYHAEDGLYTRSVAQLPPNPSSVLRDLPALWSITAVQGWREEGTFRQFQPTSARLSIFGRWSVFSWAAAPDMSGQNEPVPTTR